MPLINCPECNKQVSSFAEKCPNCGLPKSYFSIFSVKNEEPEHIIETKNISKNEPKKKRARHKLPNGYGYIKHLAGNRSHPYVAYPPTSEYTIKGNPQYKNALGYYKTYNEAYKELVLYHENGLRKDFTFKEVYEMFINEHKSNISKSTLNAYSAAFKRCKKIHDKIMRTITANEMQDILDNNPRGYSSNIQLISILKMVCEYADKAGYVDRNYGIFLKNKKKNDNEQGIPFTESDLKLMWKHRGILEIKILLILCYTGLRIGELRITKIDLNEKTMWGGLKTEKGKKRIVPIIDEIIPLYDCIDDFKKITANNFRKQVSKELADLGIYEVEKTHHTPHDARHTFNWLCDKYGVEEISKYMIIGHSLGNDIDKKVYTHRTLEELRNEISKIKVIK